jgi:hypothetical protein
MPLIASVLQRSLYHFLLRYRSGNTGGNSLRQRGGIVLPPALRFAIAADVVSDGKYLGQITEAVVDLKV